MPDMLFVIRIKVECSCGGFGVTVVNRCLQSEFWILDTKYMVCYFENCNYFQSFYLQIENVVNLLRLAGILIGVIIFPLNISVITPNYGC